MKVQYTDEILRLLNCNGQEIVRDLKNVCENARGCSQNSEISQLTAEAKLSVLERRLEADETEVRNGVCVQKVLI